MSASANEYSRMFGNIPVETKTPNMAKCACVKCNSCTCACSCAKCRRAPEEEDLEW